MIPEPIPADPRSQKRSGCWPAQWVVGAAVLAALVGAAVPAFCETAARASRASSLAKARQIAVALKVFARDNNGTYPRHGTPELLQQPATSNAAFAVLFPNYTSSEAIFGDEHSVYQTRRPDNDIDRPYTGHPVKTLEPGENVYAYLMGLTDSSDPHTPLVCDGTDGSGYYTVDPKARGGAGGGTEAVVIRLDNSAHLEALAGPPNLRFVPLGKTLAEKFNAEPDENGLDAKFYGEDARLLDPAVAAPAKP